MLTLAMHILKLIYLLEYIFSVQRLAWPLVKMTPKFIKNSVFFFFFCKEEKYRHREQMCGHQGGEEEEDELGD